MKLPQLLLLAFCLDPLLVARGAAQEQPEETCPCQRRGNPLLKSWIKSCCITDTGRRPQATWKPLARHTKGEPISATPT